MSLAVARALAELADNLYGYLPGSSPVPAYSFASAAAECGVVEYWEAGSKLPAITRLLALTLEHKRGLFCRLIEVVVTPGLEYQDDIALDLGADGQE